MPQNSWPCMGRNELVMYEWKERETYESEACLLDSWSVTSVDVEIRSAKMYASVPCSGMATAKERHTIGRSW